MGYLFRSGGRAGKKRAARIAVAGVALMAAVTAPSGLAGMAGAAAATTGGVNTGLPGSTCAPTDGGLTYTAPGPGVSTTGLPNAPAYYELGAPSGAFAGQSPKGLMITIHGGGWYVVGPAAVTAERPYADTWRNRGWETLNITYRGCAESLDDVLWFHDAARALFGPKFPLCAMGESAGAQLALMMANLRPDVGCVIAEGAPTNFVTLPLETAYDAVSGISDQTSGPIWALNLAVAAFGSSGLLEMSPTTRPGSARLLLATAQQDEFIPWAQALDMSNAVLGAHRGAYVDTDQLAGGTYNEFTHTSTQQGTGVSQAAYDDYLVRQLQAVAPLVAPSGVTKSIINDIRVASMGNYSVGDEEFDTTAGTGATSGTVSGRVALGPGQQYKLLSCIVYYDPVRPAVGWCNQSFVDTRSNAAPAAYELPSISGQWSDPAPGTGQGFAEGFSAVSYLNNGTWTRVGYSMPDNALQSGTYIPY